MKINSVTKERWSQLPCSSSFASKCTQLTIHPSLILFKNMSRQIWIIYIMFMYTTDRMDYAKSARCRGRSRRGNLIIGIGKSAIFSRPNVASQIVHHGIRGQHVISAASEERNHIIIVLLQSCDSLSHVQKKRNVHP